MSGENSLSKISVAPAVVGTPIADVTPRCESDSASLVAADSSTSPVPESPFPLAAAESIATESSGFTLRPIPDVSSAQLSRRFDIDFANIEVTSLDVVAHGCYVLAGCSNGLILLFDLSSTSRSGVIVGHIRAKGLHTNLLLTVKITEDSRFCFAGVHKGSMEMLALDLSRLPGWPETGGLSKKARKYEELIVTSSYSDPKLRGFGAVVRVQTDRGTVITAEEDSAKYILACGRGIKNVHIWTFAPDCADGPKWNFVYDVASNGNTIESVAFRDGGRQAMSKSAGMCVRMWNMSTDCPENGAETPRGTSSECDSPKKAQDADEAAEGTGSEPSAKLPYEDIANSHDVRTFADCFGFGGTYEFALVRLDAPKWANRELFELPARGMDDDNGQRRKRQMRQIQDVTSTQDGGHLLILLTDGGVLYFRAGTEESHADSGEQSETDVGQSIQTAKGGCRATLTEFSKLSFNPMEDSAWSIKRVGANGTVVLLRATRSDDANGLTTLSVCPLSDEAPGEVADTRLKSGAKWNEWEWCRNTQAMATEAMEQKFEPTPVEVETSKPAPTGRPPLNRRGGKKELAAKKEERRVLPTPLKSGAPVDYQTPGVGGPSPVAKYTKHISPADAPEKAVGADKRPGSAPLKARKKRALLSTPAKEASVEQSMEAESSRASASSHKRRRAEHLGVAAASPVATMQNISPTYQSRVTIQMPMPPSSEPLPRPPIPPYVRRQPRSVISSEIIPTPVDVNREKKSQFQAMCESFRFQQLSAVEPRALQNNYKIIPMDIQLSGLDILSFAAAGVSAASPLLAVSERTESSRNMAYVFQTVSLCLREQMNVWSQYISEVIRYVTYRFHEWLSPSERQWVNRYLPSPLPSMQAVNARYEEAMDKLLVRQRMDMSSVLSSVESGSSYRLLVADSTRSTWVDSSMHPKIVSVSGSLHIAERFERDVVSLAVGSGSINNEGPVAP